MGRSIVPSMWGRIVGTVRVPEPESLTSTVNDRLRANIARLEPPRRSPGIDLARGLAVLGMFAAHLLAVTPLSWTAPDTWLGIVEGRSAITFATLAGVSLGLLTTSSSREALPADAAAPAGSGLERARESITTRAVLIWALGLFLLGLEVPVYVVLPAYGLLLWAGARMVGWSTRALFTAAGAAAVTGPFVVALINAGGPPAPGGFAEMVSFLLGWNYPFVVWIAFVAAGLGAGRFLAHGIARVWLLLGLGAGLAVVGYGLIGPVGNAVVDRYGEALQPGTRLWVLSVLQDFPHSSGVGEAIGSGGFALALVALCVLIGRTPLRWVAWPLRAVGSMPLTAYTAHLIAWWIWMMLAPGSGAQADSLSAFRAADPFWPMTLGIVSGCVAWTLLWGRGPLERLVHYLSETVGHLSGDAGRRPGP